MNRLLVAISVAFFLSCPLLLWLGAEATPVLVVLVGIGFLPPAFRRVASFFERRPDNGERFAFALIGIAIIVALVSADWQRIEKEQAERRSEQQAAQAEAQRSEQYRAIRDSIYGRLSALMTEGLYEEVISITSDWADRGDDSLEAIQAAAEAAHDSIREIELLREVRTIPARETQENLKIYRELAALDPGNDSYKEKRDYYSLQWQREERERRERERLAAKWSYYSSSDEMTGRVTRTAKIRSENTVNFDFPYSGRQRATLTLRIHPSYGRDVIFRIEKGQILCRTYSRCRVRVRFDDAAPVIWGANPAADNSTEVIFLQSYSNFVSRLRRAKIVRIQPEIYQEGQPVFEFRVGGFNLSDYMSG